MSPVGAFRLPAELVARGYALRPETDDDLPFLLRLYASTRKAELALATGWTADQKRAFIAQQFAAQRHHYRSWIAGCAFDVIERHGRAIGRLYVQERAEGLHLVDIALLPPRRGKGVGGAILRALIDAASAAGTGVSLFVDRRNPAMRLYSSLGFIQIGETEFHIEMEWRANQRQLNVAS